MMPNALEFVNLHTHSVGSLLVFEQKEKMTPLFAYLLVICFKSV